MEDSEYYLRYGRHEGHAFDGKHGPKIPCKYPDRGPMLYEVMEYYADMTRVMNEQHYATRSTTTAAHDEFVFPRDTRSASKDQLPREPTREEIEVFMKEQADRQAKLDELAPENDAEFQASMSAPEAAQMSEGQREEAWLKRVTEQQMRRMRAGAGYNPDVTTGTRNLWDPEPEKTEDDKVERYGAVVKDTGSAEPTTSGPVKALPSTPLNFQPVCQVVDLEEEEQAPEAAAATSSSSASPPPTAASQLTVGELLRSAFPEGNPALAKMEGWLEEEGYNTVEMMLARLEGPGSVAASAREDLVECGFKEGWVEKIEGELKKLRISS